MVRATCSCTVLVPTTITLLVRSSAEKVGGSTGAGAAAAGEAGAAAGALGAAALAAAAAAWPLTVVFSCVTTSEALVYFRR